MTKAEIEQLAKEVNGYIEGSAHVIWPTRAPPPLLQHDAEAVAPLYGLTVVRVNRVNELEMYRHLGIDEVAGLLHRPTGHIVAATRWGIPKFRFTVGHELGHFLMHPHEVMHRDGPVLEDENRQRPIEEREADYFSACLHIPEDALRAEVKRRFGRDVVDCDDDNIAFKLAGQGFRTLMDMDTLRRARFVATTTSYGGPPAFESLTDAFMMSKMAVAIRLIETGIVPR